MIRKNVIICLDLVCVARLDFLAKYTFFVFHFSRAMGRNAIVFATTMFKAVCYSQDESQIITAGTDRKVSHTILSDSPNLFMLHTEKQKLAVYF